MNAVLIDKNNASVGNYNIINEGTPTTQLTANIPFHGAIENGVINEKRLLISLHRNCVVTNDVNPNIYLDTKNTFDDLINWSCISSIPFTTQFGSLMDPNPYVETYTNANLSFNFITGSPLGDLIFHPRIQL
ncbi:MAG: hypothetical protein IPK10_15325 [Bacteroidetes bacterium]|nr:hypothetical protein [Bacteroidota bacterium]